MSQEKVLKRPLTARERFRYLQHEMLPMDAIEEATLSKDLHVKTLYVYGCSLEDMNIEFIDSEEVVEDRIMNFQSREPIVQEEPIGDCEQEIDSFLEPIRVKFNDGKFPHLISPNPAIKALLVFHKDDQVSDAMTRSCERLNIESSRVTNIESALEIFQSPNGGHLLVIVDGRCKNIDTESFGRSLRSLKGSQYTTMVAVVKKSDSEEDDNVILALLDSSYNQCIIESPHVSMCSFELLQIQNSIVQQQSMIASQQALYAALHRVNDTVIITDDALRVQYTNLSTERILGLKLDEIVGRSLEDIISSDVSLLLSQTNRLKDFEGSLTFKGKIQDPLVLRVHATPVTNLNKSASHIALILSNIQSGSQELALPSIAQVKASILRGPQRGGSYDTRLIASNERRRKISAKLSSLPLKEQIIKILPILQQVQENCSNDQVELLDQVIDILMGEDDAKALLAKTLSNVVSSESIVQVSSRQSLTSQLSKDDKVPKQVSVLLRSVLEWDFEIFRLEELTDKHPLVYLGLELFRRFDVFNTFNCDEGTFRSWLMVIESHYHSVNTYHNSSHAADVMQATACFLQQLTNRDLKIMDRLDEATTLIASAVHDIDHPGRTSSFMCKSGNSLALLYNDICVLESHHAATTFLLTLSDERVNIFKNLDRDMYKLARSVIIDMILATEMTRHYDHYSQFLSVFGPKAASCDLIDDVEKQTLVRRMLIKCSDVSNPVRPLKICVEWARRIAEEYILQTDEELRKGLPIEFPIFNRVSCSIPKSQIGFIDGVIKNLMDAWDGFIDMPELMQHMQHNYNQWKLFEEQGINTLDDIKRKQLSISATSN